jgi:hypothetical protein
LQRPVSLISNFSFKDFRIAPETRLADSWAVKIDEKYYRPGELEKVRFRQLPVESARKEEPFGPFATEAEKTNFKY